MPTHTLTRSGQAPLKFTGERIAEASTWSHQGPGQNRWHELAVYRTDGGNYVAACTYHTQWQGELPHHWALETDAAGNVPLLLLEIAAELAEHVGGYPPGEPYAQKQARLLADLRARFDAAVSDLLAGEQFAETID